MLATISSLITDSRTAKWLALPLPFDRSGDPKQGLSFFFGSSITLLDHQQLVFIHIDCPQIFEGGDGHVSNQSAELVWRVFVFHFWSSLAQTVKNPPAKWQTWVRSLDWEDPLEEGMATHSSIVAWRIPLDRGARQAIVHGVTKSQSQLSD